MQGKTVLVASEGCLGMTATSSIVSRLEEILKCPIIVVSDMSEVREIAEIPNLEYLAIRNPQTIELVNIADVYSNPELSRGGYNPRFYPKIPRDIIMHTQKVHLRQQLKLLKQKIIRGG
jgi:hypothetical protein